MQSVCYDLIKPPPKPEEIAFTKQYLANAKNRNHNFLKEIFKTLDVEYSLTDERLRSSLDNLPSISSNFAQLACFTCTIEQQPQLF
jgi:hypothetical protein